MRAARVPACLNVATLAVVMPHLPERDHALVDEAVASVHAQTRKPDQFILERDVEHTGAAATQNRALEKVTCDFIALLGDDDFFLPNHLEVLEAHATADVVYPDCIQLGAMHPSIGGEFNAARLRGGNYIPGGGSLIRTEAVRAVGGWCKPGDPDWHPHEDWRLWLRLLDAGYTFRYVPQQTWCYRFHSQQTGGQA